mmetsp:Transcript_33284/g.58400  ORF Transcript_33284/g.58400 Transcript_33284/m.58400 type:complete len:220 (+) Transcript_33284:968-1627(+)
MMESWDGFLLNFGAILIILLNLSPAPSMLKAWKNQSTKGMSAFFLLSCNYCGVFWTIYSYKIGNYPMMYNNIPPTLISLIWTCLYFAIEKRLASFLLKYLTVTLALTAIFIQWVDISFTGTVAVLANLGIILAPIEFIANVIKEKNPNMLDLNILAASTLCSLDWAAYGWLHKDFFVIAPNIFGLYMSLMQVVVYLWAKGYLPHGLLAPLANMQGYKAE